MNACALEHPYQSGELGQAAGNEPLRPGGLELSARAIQCAGFAAGERILDLGCGNGGGTRLLGRQGCLAVGLDLAADRLAQARRSLPGLAAVAGDACRLPFADESLDGVLAECSLSLAGYTASTLVECRRVLRPGGRLAVTDVFARIEDKEAMADSRSLPGCLAGLSPRSRILAALAAAGFLLQRWEDHSEVLKSFLAQLIFSGRGTADLWTGDGSAYTTALRACRPGYFLLVAAKATRST